MAGLLEFALEHANCPPVALEYLRASAYDVVLADFPIPDWSPEEWLEEVHRTNSLLPVVIRDSGATCADAVRLTKLGAYHVFDATADIEELARVLEQAVIYRRERELALFGGDLAQEPWKKFLVGESRPMREIAQVIRLIGARRSTVLITGETGTGKEVLARAIHMASNRSHLPMVAVNCHALPENLLEAELFGHVKGAFTGAIAHRIGRFEQAHRSTLFLDEIGDLPLDLQAKLLRVLQEREIQRLGSSETVSLDVRVLAATNTDLAESMRQRTFREDLYYRLNVVPIRVPPLRERLSDIPLLVHHFVEKVCRQEDLPPRQVARETLDRLSDYSWPGNVRQLENAVEMAIVMAGDRRDLYPGDFPLPSTTLQRPCPAPVGAFHVPDDGLDFEQTISRIERTILDQALQRTGGNKKQAAEMLRLKRTTLSAKLKSLEMETISS
jgi:DNA-binding NtrC family response regulator